MNPFKVIPSPSSFQRPHHDNGLGLVNLMLLSAGKGERLRPWTDQQPKPAIPFMGVPMSAWVHALADRFQIDRLVVNTHHFPQKIEDLHWRLKLPCRELCFSHEEKLLASAGGINQAKDFLQGHQDFLAANADSIFFPSKDGVIEDLLRFHRAQQNLSTLLVLKHTSETSGFGGFACDENGFVKSFEQKSPRDNQFHFIGWAAHSDRIFQYMNFPVGEEHIFRETLPKAILEGERVQVFVTEGHWFETGSVGPFTAAEAVCEKVLNSSVDSAMKRMLEQTRNKFGLWPSVIKA